MALHGDYAARLPASLRAPWMDRAAPSDIDAAQRLAALLEAEPLRPRPSSRRPAGRGRCS